MELYTNQMCWNVPDIWIKQADEIKAWAIDNSYPIRVYFCDSGIQNYYFGEKLQKDGYCADIWGSPMDRGNFPIADMELFKQHISTHFKKHPTYDDFRKYDNEQTEKWCKTHNDKRELPSVGLVIFLALIAAFGDIIYVVLLRSDILLR